MSERIHANITDITRHNIGHQKVQLDYSGSNVILKRLKLYYFKTDFEYDLLYNYIVYMKLV